MKKYITLLSIILVITSCDKIDNNDFGNSTIIDNDTVVNFALRKILIEDFTGHLCPNCPDAARELEAIHDTYGNQIIGMAIHVSKSFARPYPASQAPKFQYDFRTDWGDDWDEYFGISESGLPKGMVNRIGFENEIHKLGKNEWDGAVINLLESKPMFNISVLPANLSDHHGFIDINTTSIYDTTGSYNLVVCLTESQIINWQKDGQDNVESYEHNHVLRTVLIDEALSNTISYNEQEIIFKRYNYNIDDLEQYNIDYSTNNTAELGNGNAGDWNASNMSIIAYIYNTTTKEIVQVEESHLNN